MPAVLKKTELDVKTQTVSITVNIIVQNQVFEVICVAPTTDLLSLAQADGRSDWNTQDCADIASTEIGMTVNVS
jgi:hypothetical protein